MESVRRFKRFVREHPYSRNLYAFLADRWTRIKISVCELAFGRYYNAARFDQLFCTAPDPWSYVGCSISERRRQLILRTLPKQHYTRLLEVGCAEGWMTLALALRAEELVSADISTVALARAREKCHDFPNVHFIQIDLLKESFVGHFDGIVCAGVLVFLPMSVQLDACNRLVAATAPAGHLLLEHTRDSFPGQIAGSRVHELYRNHPKLVVMSHLVVDNYEIILFRKKSM